MDHVTDLLTSIYSFYKGSCQRHKAAEEVIDITDEQFLEPEKANGTRQVDDKLRAVTKLVKYLKVTIIHLMDYGEDIIYKIVIRLRKRTFMGVARV